MTRIWRFIRDCLEALVDDDRNIAQRQRDHEDALQKWLSYLGSGKR
jgi:hypothetical protein